VFSGEHFRKYPTMYFSIASFSFIHLSSRYSFQQSVLLLPDTKFHTHTNHTEIHSSYYFNFLLFLDIGLEDKNF
jgi:hypothetical protein